MKHRENLRLKKQGEDGTKGDSTHSVKGSSSGLRCVNTVSTGQGEGCGEGWLVSAGLVMFWEMEHSVKRKAQCAGD